MVITLTGTNSFLLKQEVTRIVQDFLATHDPMGFEQIDGEEAEYDRISEAATSLPFLADKKLVLIRNGSGNKRFIEHAEKLLADVPDSTQLVIIESKLDKRSGYYKYLKKATDYREFAELDANGLSRWLVDRARTLGTELNTADARYLIDRVGLNQQLLYNELDKLCLYDPEAPKISRQVIDMLTEAAPQSTVFELLEAAFAGNVRRAMTLYQEQRTLKVEPQQIIAMVAWQLHILALVKTATDRSPDQIAKDAKLSPYVVKKSAPLARTLSLAHIKRLIADLLTIDSRLKRESLDADEVMQTYLLKLA